MRRDWELVLLNENSNPDQVYNIAKAILHDRDPSFVNKSTWDRCCNLELALKALLKVSIVYSKKAKY